MNTRSTLYELQDPKPLLNKGGCVAPAKKGAIENKTLSNGRICAWGSLVRQNY